ncbi:MAG: leucine-rich repeat protein [Lachnospiraceae bacterium]|jgi:hypothetical protein|nr:leucine-rich repeat protein [Lachnospiraceae bacterium]
MIRFKMRRKILLAGLAILGMAGIIKGEGTKADAASAPKMVGAEKVLYLDGKNQIAVQGKHIVSIKYASTKSGIATVDSKGIVKPRAKGKTVVSAQVVYKKTASGKRYTKKIKYNLKVIGKSEEYFQISMPTDLIGTYNYCSIKGLTDKGRELKKLYIPSYIKDKKVTRIIGSGIKDCPNMESLHLTDNLTYIIKGAVMDCPKLKRLYIGKKLSNLGKGNVFLRCSALEEIILDERNKNFVLDDGVLFSADKTDLLLYPRAQLHSSYTIPNGVEYIGSGAFAGCKHLKEIKIPESVEQLSQRCFSGSGLLRIEIPDEVEYMGAAVFQNCVSLSEIKLSKQFTSIYGDAFKKCISLKSLFLPASINWLEPEAFEGCSQLEQIEVAEASQYFYTKDGVLFSKQENQLVCYPVGKKEKEYHVPDDITIIKESAFNQCKFLERVKLPEGMEQIGPNVFIGSGIKEIELPDTIKVIGSFAFQDCKALSKVKLSGSLIELPSGVFSGCESLHEITIPKEVSRISSNAFENCNNLKCILIDKENTTFTESEGIVFSKSMQTLYLYPNGREARNYTVPATVTNIEEGAFRGAKWLCGVSIPNSVKSIGYSAFRDCENLETVKLPASIEKIASEMFLNCSSMKKITIPSSVKRIGNEVFKGCTSLETVTVPNSVERLEYNLFSDCSSLRKVKLGKEISYIGSSVFSNCTELTKIEIKSKKLTEKSFGSGVFKGAGKDKGKKLVVVVPSEKRNAYQKLLFKKGLPKNATVK